MKQINMSQLQQQLGNINLIDIREEYEYAEGYIPSAKNIPMNELIQNHQNYLNQDQDYYIVCAAGGRSQMTCMVLDAQGYKVINVMGGTSAYPGQLE